MTVEHSTCDVMINHLLSLVVVISSCVVAPFASQPRFHMGASRRSLLSCTTCVQVTPADLGRLKEFYPDGHVCLTQLRRKGENRVLSVEACAEITLDVSNVFEPPAWHIDSSALAATVTSVQDHCADAAVLLCFHRDVGPVALAGTEARRVLIDVFGRQPTAACT